MTPETAPNPDYRPCVGIMLFNAAGEVFVGQRMDMAITAWQMPQGGIDPGETPAEAALRELEEEIGTAAAEILAETESWLHYDLPDELRGRIWGGKFRGQAQKWVLARFTGVDDDIDIATAHPEFSEWRWLAPDELETNIVAFKREIYAEVVRAFGGLIRLNTGG